MERQKSQKMFVLSKSIENLKLHITKNQPARLNGERGCNDSFPLLSLLKDHFSQIFSFLIELQVEIWYVHLVEVLNVLFEDFDSGLLQPYFTPHITKVSFRAVFLIFRIFPSRISPLAEIWYADSVEILYIQPYPPIALSTASKSIFFENYSHFSSFLFSYLSFKLWQGVLFFIFVSKNLDAYYKFSFFSLIFFYHETMAIILHIMIYLSEMHRWGEGGEEWPNQENLAQNCRKPAKSFLNMKRSKFLAETVQTVTKFQYFHQFSYYPEHFSKINY